MTGEDGKDLEPLAGPSLTGLRNLGNSCYINSVLQALFSLPSFASRYLLPFATHPLLCSKTDPATCLDCQMHKLADGLLSGRYAKPREAVEGDESTPTGPAFQEGIRPSMFKALVGKGHPEFATMRQQDADEFLRHLFKSIQRSLPPGANAVTAGVDEVDPTLQFRFAMEQRLSCNSCGGVRYRIDEQDAITIPVPAVEKPSAAAPMDVDGADGKAKASEPVKVEYESVKVEECLDILTRADVIEYKCPSCNKAVSATKCVGGCSGEADRAGPCASPPSRTRSSSTLHASSRSATSRARSTCPCSCLSARARSCRSIRSSARASSPARPSSPRTLRSR